MDGRSHVLFGKLVLEKAGLDTGYCEWATAPDIDLEINYVSDINIEYFIFLNKFFKKF